MPSGWRGAFAAEAPVKMPALSRGSLLPLAGHPTCLTHLAVRDRSGSEPSPSESADIRRLVCSYRFARVCQAACFKRKRGGISMHDHDERHKATTRICIVVTDALSLVSL